MDGYFAFSDECGQYEQDRNAKFIAAHPFYVRSTALMKISDYVALEAHVHGLRETLSIPGGVEIKWSEVGNRFKGRRSEETRDISDNTIKQYIENVVHHACETSSLCTVFTVFSNASPNRIGKHNMIKMHIQDSLQRIYYEIRGRDAYATLIIDDIGDNNNSAIKHILHDVLTYGDFVDYSKINKSILVDYSDHCIGLQLADYCAGIFTSCLKRVSAGGRNYEYAHYILSKYLYRTIRFNVCGANSLITYRYGIKDVPSNLASTVCIELAKMVDNWILDYHGGPFLCSSTDT